MALSKEISQSVILEDFIKACKLGFNHSQGHHYGYTKEELNDLIGEILFICGLDRSDYVEPDKATELLTSSSKVVTTEEVCECGNVLTEKEVFYGQCLKCGKVIIE